MRGVFDVGERLASESTTGDVEGERQGDVVLGVHKQAEIRAENPSHRPLHLLTTHRDDWVSFTG